MRAHTRLHVHSCLLHSHECSLVLSRFWETRLTSFFCCCCVANVFSSALVHLKVLDIRKNQFKTLPDTIQFYTDLRKLNISHNQLLNLGSAIRNCEVLEEIWCQVLSFLVFFQYAQAGERDEKAGEREACASWRKRCARDERLIFFNTNACKRDERLVFFKVNSSTSYFLKHSVSSASLPCCYLSLPTLKFFDP